METGFPVRAVPWQEPTRSHDEDDESAMTPILRTNKKNTLLRPLFLERSHMPKGWVLRIKRDAKGKFEKYECRIVVKGYSQIAGLDFNETFAAVVRIELIVIFALAAANDLYILHIHCKNAFLHCKSGVEIYVTQPEGFVDERFPAKVLHLTKSFYSLKQAPRIWYLFLSGVVSELGFVALETDSCIHVQGNSSLKGDQEDRADLSRS